MGSGLSSTLRRLARRAVPTATQAPSPAESKCSIETRVVAPRVSAARRSLCGVVVVRDSAANIAEWLEFHRRSGLEHVYMYDNGLEEAALEVVHDPIFSDFVTVIPFLTPGHPGFTRLIVSSKPDVGRLAPSVFFQQLAYWHAITNFGAGWRWMTFIDSDEFLFPAAATDLCAALEDYSDLPGLVMFWSMFGFSGHEAPPPGGIVANYTRRSVFPVGAKTKVIVDPRNVSTIWTIHLIGDRLFDEQRRPVDAVTLASFRRVGDPTGAYLPTHDVLRLNHYFTRSKSEFEAKHRRLIESGDRGAAKKLLDRAELIERDTVEDLSALRFLSMRDSAITER